MMSDYRGMTPQNLTLESKNWTLGGNGGSKFVKTSSDIIYGCPLDGFQTFVFESHWQNFKSFYSQHWQINQLKKNVRRSKTYLCSYFQKISILPSKNPKTTKYLQLLSCIKCYDLNKNVYEGIIFYYLQLHLPFSDIITYLHIIQTCK